MWRVFLDLHTSRGNNGFSANPITYHEIYSYSKLYDLDFDIWEIELIKGFDRYYLQVQAEANERKTK